MTADIGSKGEQVGGTRAEVLQRLRDLLADTREYMRRRADYDRNATRELAARRGDLEAMIPVVQGRLPLVIDANLGRVVSHNEPERGNKPELNDAQRILAEEAARREAMFQQSVNAEKTRGDALSRRFEEALKQARQEPITRPERDFDLD